MRFEASYYEGEPRERSPHWEVIEWTLDNGAGHRSGHAVQRCSTEEEAVVLADMLNKEYAFGENA